MPEYTLRAKLNKIVGFKISQCMKHFNTRWDLDLLCANHQIILVRLLLDILNRSSIR